MADQLQKFVSEKKGMIESVMDAFEKGSEVAAAIIGDLFPVFSVAAPIITLCMDNVKSEEAVYMKNQFENLRDRLDVVSEETQKVFDEIKKSAAFARYFSVEENIISQFRHYMDILDAKDKYREAKKNIFLDHWGAASGDKNLDVLYNAVTGGDTFLGESVLEIMLNCEEKSRRVVEDFCFRLMKLFCFGIIALMGHTALKGYGDEVEGLLNTWNEKMKDVQSKMNAVIEDCIVSFPKQAELDSRRLVRNHSDLTNQELADAIIEKLKKKYDWVLWSVRVYQPPGGWLSGFFHKEFHCVTGKSFFQVSSSDEKLNVMVSYSASPEPVDRNNIQRLIQGQTTGHGSTLIRVAELLSAELPGPCMVHTVKTKCRDLACSTSFTDEEHYWEEFAGKIYICAHSA